METGLEGGHLIGLTLAPAQLDGPWQACGARGFVSSSEDWKLPVPHASSLTPDLSASSSSPTLYVVEFLKVPS